MFRMYEKTVRLSVSPSVNDCAKTVQDRPMVCEEVEWECGVDNSICTILEPQRPAYDFPIWDTQWDGLILPFEFLSPVADKTNVCIDYIL